MSTSNTEKLKPIRRCNLVMEYDGNADISYIFVCPYSSKNPPKVASNQSFTIPGGVVVFDFDESGSLAGIEIPNSSSLIKINLSNEK